MNLRAVPTSDDETLACSPDELRCLVLEARRDARATRKALDRVADELCAILARELPAPVREGVIVALRATAGVEALAEAIAEGVVREVGP